MCCIDLVFWRETSCKHVTEPKSNERYRRWVEENINKVPFDSEGKNVLSLHRCGNYNQQTDRCGKLSGVGIITEAIAQMKKYRDGGPATSYQYDLKYILMRDACGFCRIADTLIAEARERYDNRTGEIYGGYSGEPPIVPHRFGITNEWISRLKQVQYQIHEYKLETMRGKMSDQILKAEQMMRTVIRGADEHVAERAEKAVALAKGRQTAIAQVSKTLTDINKSEGEEKARLEGTWKVQTEELGKYEREMKEHNSVSPPLVDELLQRKD